MKKTFKIGIVVGFGVACIILAVVCILCFLLKNADKAKFIDSGSVSNVNVVDLFCEKVNGFWINESSDGGKEILCFENKMINDYDYRGHMWLSDAEIKSVEEIDENSYKVTVNHQEIVYGDEESGEIEVLEFVFESTDDFQKHLIWKGNDVSLEFLYLGEKKEDVENYIENTINEYENLQQDNVPTCVKCGQICEYGRSYCEAHACWKSDCQMPKKYMSVYCVNHSCLLCGSENTYDSSYCSKHKCNRGNCSQVVVEGSNYCIEHN